MKLLHALFYGLACLCALAGCRPSGSAEGQDAPLPTLTVSIEPLRYLAERIAGDGFRVETFVPKGSSPETYEPTPEQMVKLSESLAFFMVGDLGFERTWADKLRQTASDVPFVRTSEGIRLAGGHRHGTATPEEEATDPHVWTSPAGMRTLAQNICTSLCRLDTARAGQFRQNLRQVLADIQSTEDSIRHMVESTPQKTFLIYHPTLTYFARDFGLEQVAIEADGKEPSPAQIVRLIRLCRERKARTIFIQKEFDRRNAEIIAQETGTRLVEINPLAYDWKKEMLHIARTLQAQ